MYKSIKKVCVYILIIIGVLLIYQYTRKPTDYISKEPIIMQYTVEKVSDIPNWIADNFCVNVNDLILESCFIVGDYPKYDTEIKITYSIINTNSGDKVYPYKVYEIVYNYSKNIIETIHTRYEDTIYTFGIEMEQIDVKIEDVLHTYPKSLELDKYDINFGTRIGITKINNGWIYRFYQHDGNELDLTYEDNSSK